LAHSFSLLSLQRFLFFCLILGKEAIDLKMFVGSQPIGISIVSGREEEWLDIALNHTLWHWVWGIKEL
jgi:hypothetical protein